ncbi:hypothetical protein N658DRAFT_483229 [Parathielavia hyrcaniae]|uniref:Uncharacterized protein n=1 Tax=Parathielavia hyrcaniae TaxID=113614 RepID=A0AAN6QEN6_9PEZI|nr:hypothetical protein N658DRAFT_483229 [Parathielavia hyrcaniae]
MSTPFRTPTRRSTQDSWDIISEPTFTRTRTPQLNGDNISSNRVANTYASDGSSVSLIGRSEAYLDMADAIEPAYDPAHIPPSNVESTSSEETTVTGGTVTNLNNPAPAPTPCRAEPPAAVCQQLTLQNMEFFQRELTQCWTHTLSGWIEGAGMGDRLVRNMSFGSVLTAANTSQASGSTAATAGVDWYVVPAPATANEDVAAVGPGASMS